MKNWGDAIIQVLFTWSLIGFGVLCGLALAILVNHVEIGGVAPLFATAFGSVIRSTVAVSGALFVARLNERRGQLTALDEALFPIDEFVHQLMGLHNLVNRRKHPSWDVGGGPIAVGNAYNHLLKLFEKIVPVPGLPPGVGQHIQVMKMPWTMQMQAYAEMLKDVAAPTTAATNDAVDRTLKFSTEFLQSVATFAQGTRDRAQGRRQL